MSNPVLRLKALPRTANGRTHTLKAEGGLHFIRGNSAPYFSLTYSEYVGTRMESGGANHEEILRHWPDLADLAALHLSDIDGAPMHAVENGFYHLGGTRWQAPKFDVAARHFRITEDAARALVSDLFGDWYSTTGGFLTATAASAARARLAAWVDTQRARWQAEASACIAAHGLTVYGDHWTRA